MSKPPRISYSPTGRAACKGCKRPIGEGYMRVAIFKRSPFHDGFDAHYHHYSCAKKKSTEPPRGWRALRWKDQLTVAEGYGLAPPPESEKGRTDQLWAAMDVLLGVVPRKVLEAVFDQNEYVHDKKTTPADLCYRLCDGLLFGALPCCPTCSTRALVPQGAGAECTGWYSAATRCEFVCSNLERDVGEREAFQLPAIAACHKAIKEWTQSNPQAHSSQTPGAPAENSPGKAADAVKTEAGYHSEDEAARAVPVGHEMEGMVVVLVGPTGGFNPSKTKIKSLVEDHNGTVMDTIVIGATTHVVTSDTDVTTGKLATATAAGIPVVTPAYVVDLCDRKSKGWNLRRRTKMMAGGYLLNGEAGAPLRPVKEIIGIRKDEAKRDAKEEKQLQMLLSKRPVITPGSEILKVYHEAPHNLQGGTIYTDDDGKTAYNAMLTSADLQTGVNKFYCIQIIAKGKSFYFFTAWGRVGGSMSSRRNNYKEERFAAVDGAIALFEDKFKQMTGVDWHRRLKFEQQPGGYNYVELDSGTPADKQKRAKKQKVRAEPVSKLDPRLKQFIQRIFDKKMVEETLARSDVDMEKMPLGSISKRTINVGYAILNEIHDIISAGPSKDQGLKLRDASNRFYTMIPHQFSYRSTPPVIQKESELNAKISLLNDLDEVVIANSLAERTEMHREEMCVEDSQYASLQCELVPLEETDEMFQLVKDYVKNSHGATHNTYTLEVKNVFAAARHGEEEKYKPWEDMHNKRLLWHGSRLMNWVGILSQGLRIAPPEAPVSGYMFGKGVYWADRISKSANYCSTSREHNTGVVCLGEVALGDMYERYNAEMRADQSCKKKNKHSTWGLGRTQPDPKGDRTVWNNVLVPMGAARRNTDPKLVLEYNEFIVYDTSQIKMKYVVELEFVYK